ncbi:hypothetical protein [Ectobacillus ponti]|uniref:Uncharacterized protein n=1 Tax=Ectobacillus ponti TaxID=2961894 RepID=A0AA42BSV1_9BACI|nr:hypothetical protein [Ectobacillus ponti]MCP8970929.1 hypothetical protein [Ectobacillus ponti]
MNAAERKVKLQELIATKKPCRTGIPIMYHGVRREFDAYEIPLEYLVYNPYNGRIGSMVKSYERQHHTINPEDPQDKKLIEKFLWESKIDANKKTKERLLREHQEKHGIVTADGSIIDGNRRSMLLNNIMADHNIPFNEKSHCQFFIAIILPDDANKKEILALETTYQMGEDVKVDYNPIEKYLKCKDLQDAGFTPDDIAQMMDIKPGEVRTMLSALQLMDDYLDEYDYSGMYTQLDKNEDSFLKLDSALKKYRAGVPSMWAYDPDADVSDLKLIAFDYIREGFEQTLFRNIISAPSAKKPASSFFAKEEVWGDFRDRHFAITDAVEEYSVAEIMASNQTDLSRALKARDQQWKLKVGDDLEENFTLSLDKLNNHADAAKPLQLLIKACQALEVVDVTQESFQRDRNIRGCVESLEEFVTKFKGILGM